jgi:hypothetical protein
MNCVAFVLATGAMRSRVMVFMLKPPCALVGVGGTLDYLSNPVKDNLSKSF